MLCSEGNPTPACSLCQDPDAVSPGCHNHQVETPPGTGYCIACGERLEPGHRFCWACGAERWRPPAAQQPQAAGRPPPSPGTPALIPSVPVPRAPTAEATPVPGLAWLYGAGAVV